MNEKPENPVQTIPIAGNPAKAWEENFKSLGNYLQEIFGPSVKVSTYNGYSHKNNSCIRLTTDGTDYNVKLTFEHDRIDTHRERVRVWLKTGDNSVSAENQYGMWMEPTELFNKRFHEAVNEYIKEGKWLSFKGFSKEHLAGD